jgi:hypothetical protein
MKLLEIPIYFRSRGAARSERYWRCYDYNEIIGWVVLEPRPNAIRAEFWMVLQQPCSGLIRKQFENKGKLFKIGIAGFDNNAIFFRLKAAFQDVQANSYLSKYHFDLEVFERLGPHIDWISMLSECSA